MDSIERMLEQFKGWFSQPLFHVGDVEVGLSRNFSTTCAAMRVATLTLIERDIELEGILDEEQRAQLLAIANHCPVHQTLTSQMNIRTRLA